MGDRLLLATFIHGIPRPQGSINRGRGAPYTPALLEWRHTLAKTFRTEWADQGPLTEGVYVDLLFHFRRPMSHYRTGKFADQLKPTASYHMVTAPDLDKLVRAVGDALVNADVLKDDSQIVMLSAEKHWVAPEEATGLSVQVRGF